MITAHKKNHIKRISGPTKLNIALQAIRRQHTVTEISRQFEALASQYNISIETIWTICYSARYDIDSVKYHETSCALESLLGLQYEEIEDAVLHILETTHRCSSMIENFNSRLRPYLDERKFMSQKSLDLIRFYLNYKPFMRSKHERLVGMRH